MPTRYRLVQIFLYVFLFVSLAGLVLTKPVGHWLVENYGVVGFFVSIFIYAAAVCASVFGLKRINQAWSFDELPWHSSEKAFGSAYYVESNQIVIEETECKKVDNSKKPEFDV